MSEYFVDGEAVLPNKLGIDKSEDLKSAEEEIVAARMAELSKKPISGDLGFNTLKVIHSKLFSDIYDFAGKIRTVRIAKGNSVFCYPEFIDDEIKRIFGYLQNKNYLIGLTMEEFIDQFAFLTGELNALHPFREGNGRAIRLYLKELAENAGWYIAYEDINSDELLDADIKSFEGNLLPLIQLLQMNTVEHKLRVDL